MLVSYDPNAPKKFANLSVNSDLLKRARELKINLSSIRDQASTVRLMQREVQPWLTQNKDAIAAYNKSVEENGVFSDGLRSF